MDANENGQAQGTQDVKSEGATAAAQDSFSAQSDNQAAAAPEASTDNTATGSVDASAEAQPKAEPAEVVAADAGLESADTHLSLADEIEEKAKELGAYVHAHIAHLLERLRNLSL